MNVRPGIPTVPILKPGSRGVGAGECWEVDGRFDGAGITDPSRRDTLRRAEPRPGGPRYPLQRARDGRSRPAGRRPSAETLDASSLAALYCGPGESVVRTAEIVGKALGLRPKRIDEFRNLDQGLWQGLQIDEIKRRNTKLFRQWIEDPVTICPPQGETVEGAMERIKAAFRPLIRRHQDGESAWSSASRWPGWSLATCDASPASSSTTSCPAAASNGSTSRLIC